MGAVGAASAEVDGSNGSISAAAANAKGTNGADIGKEEGSDGEEDDEDVDGVPLDVPGLPAAGSGAADFAVPRGSNNSSSLQARGGPPSSSQSSGFSMFEGSVKGAVTAGAGQWKTVKTTNLEDSPSSSSSDEEDVDGVPLDGPAAGVGGVVPRSTSDIGRSNGKGPLSPPVSAGKSTGASAGSVKTSAEEGNKVLTTRGVFRDQEASGGTIGGLKQQQQGEGKARARARARSRASDSSSDDSDGEGDGPGKIDVWGDDDVESNNAMENAEAGGDEGVKGGGLSGMGIGGAGGGGSGGLGVGGGVGGAVSDTASKMNEDEQVSMVCFSRGIQVGFCVSSPSLFRLVLVYGLISWGDSLHFPPDVCIFLV